MVQWSKYQWSQGSMVPGSKGPRYLKVIFKYELDSKEGPSCILFNTQLGKYKIRNSNIKNYLFKINNFNFPLMTLISICNTIHFALNGPQMQCICYYPVPYGYHHHTTSQCCYCKVIILNDFDCLKVA